VKEHLANALANCYGGHIWDTFLALKRLHIIGGASFRFRATPNELSGCLKWPGDGTEPDNKK
jgi:hypothetical protein